MCRRRLTGNDGGKNTRKEERQPLWMERVVKGVECRRVGGRRDKGMQGGSIGGTKSGGELVLLL